MTKLESALLITPFDVQASLIAYGAEQAFLWTGQRPQSENDFYFELGRKIQQMALKAWEEELDRGY